MVEKRGHDRCTNSETGVCGLHELLEDERKEHRQLICAKIREKADKDLNDQEHKTMVSDIAEIKTIAVGACERSLPIWVFKWIGGASIFLLLSFTGWTALKGFSYGDRLTRLEFQTDALLTNQTKMMEFFNIQPAPIPTKK